MTDLVASSAGFNLPGTKRHSSGLRERLNFAYTVGDVDLLIWCDGMGPITDRNTISRIETFRDFLAEKATEESR